MAFLPQTYTQYNDPEKNIRQIPGQNILPNSWPELLKAVKLIKGKENLRNFPSLEEPKETKGLNVK